QHDFLSFSGRPEEHQTVGVDHLNSNPLASPREDFRIFESRRKIEKIARSVLPELGFDGGKFVLRYRGKPDGRVSDYMHIRKHEGVDALCGKGMKWLFLRMNDKDWRVALAQWKCYEHCIRVQNAVCDDDLLHPGLIEKNGIYIRDLSGGIGAPITLRFSKLVPWRAPWKC